MKTNPDSLFGAKLITLLLAILVWFVIRQRAEPWRGSVFSASPAPAAQHD
jgi:hypothetical protein